MMSRADYARHRKENGLPGGSKPSVTYAIQDGRITIDPVTQLIDSEKADAQWLANTNPQASATGVKAGAAAAKVHRERAAQSPPPDYAVARAQREHYESELARIKFEEKAKILVPARVIQKFLYSCGRIIRAGHDDLISQMAPALASETNIAGVERILKRSLDNLDNELANRIEKWVVAEEFDEDEDGEDEG